MIQQAQLTMIVEEINHRPLDSVVTLRTDNGLARRDSILWLSATAEQVNHLTIGQSMRVTVDILDGGSAHV